MLAKDNVEENFSFCRQQIEKGAAEEAEMLFFPECFYYFPQKSADHMSFAKPMGGNPDVARFSALAKEHNMWLSLGGLQVKSDDPAEERMENTHLLIDNQGQTVSRYVKSHLYDVDLDAVNTIRESDFSVPGPSLPQVVHPPMGPLGICICYDLRFP